MGRLDMVEKDARRLMRGAGPAHDFAHATRVRKNAVRICGDRKILELCEAAALLHDVVSYPKTSKKKRDSAADSAVRAGPVLKKRGYSESEARAICSAIKGHSYSSGRRPRGAVAAVLQDADRLDALGAAGIARAFAVAGEEGREFYAKDDPFCAQRAPDDKRWTIDHFYAKLLRLPDSMNTDAGRAEARKRAVILRAFLRQLEREI